MSIIQYLLDKQKNEGVIYQNDEFKAYGYGNNLIVFLVNNDQESIQVVDLHSDSDLSEHSELIKTIGGLTPVEMISSNPLMRNMIFVSSLSNSIPSVSSSENLKLCMTVSKKMCDDISYSERLMITDEIIKENGGKKPENMIQHLDLKYTLFKHHGENMDHKHISEMIDSIHPGSDQDASQFISVLIRKNDSESVVMPFQMALTPALKQYLDTVSIYGSSKLDSHYLEISERADDGALVMRSKFNQIIGGFTISPLNEELEKALFQKLESLNLVKSREEYLNNQRPRM